MIPLHWQCGDCDARVADLDLLRAQHPFDPEDVVSGCPKCFGLELHPVCDEPECRKGVSCGSPSPDGGYRRTCWQHSPMNPENE